MSTEAGAEPAPRPLRLALKRGLLCRCPACGEAKLFRAFLKPIASCPSCGEDWTTKSADDFPAYLTILVLGHLLVPIIVEVNLYTQISETVQMIAWPLIAGVMAVLMIQPAKGFVIALQWAR